MSNERRFDPTATQRLRNVGGNSGEHAWRNLLGDAIASMGDQIENIREEAIETREQITQLRIKTDGVSLVEMSKIAKSAAENANKPIEQQLSHLTRIQMWTLTSIMAPLIVAAIAWLVANR